MNFFKTKQIERLKASATYSQLVIKNSFILNSGSAIAIMTYIGHLKEKNQEIPQITEITRLPYAMLFFAIGTLCCVICGFFAFLSQLEISEITKKRKMKNTGKCKRKIAIVSGTLSLIFFIFGLFAALSYFW